MDHIQPTASDRQRDLAADLLLCEMGDTVFLASALAGWPAAIRRALHAEAEAAHLRRLLIDALAEGEEM